MAGPFQRMGPGSNLKRVMGAVVLAALSMAWAGGASGSTDAVVVATYDPATREMQAMLHSGRAVLHRDVPVELFDSYMSSFTDDFYRKQIIANYPPIDPDPLHEVTLGPVDQAYIDTIKDPPPALLSFCELALQNALRGAESALREIDRLDRRSSREGDGQASAVASSTRSYVLQTRSAANEALQRIKRKEFAMAHRRVEWAANELQHVVNALPAATKQASSVSIREQHQASNFISGYQQLLSQAEKALKILVSRVEESAAPSVSPTP